MTLFPMKVLHFSGLRDCIFSEIYVTVARGAICLKRFYNRKLSS